MEKLYELATERDYDLIVLDTPPTAHALDFLDAPDRVLDFLGNETARDAARAGARRRASWGSGSSSSAAATCAKTLARFTGAAVLADLGDFLAGFQGMYEGFKERAAAVRALLSQPDVGFVLVASPAPRLHRRGARLPRAAPRRGDADRRRRREPRHAGALARSGAAAPAAELAAALAAARRGAQRRRRASRRGSRATLAEHETLARAERRAIGRLFARSAAARARRCRASRPTCTTSRGSRRHGGAALGFGRHAPPRARGADTRARPSSSRSPRPIRAALRAADVASAA